jgi:predicted nuclease of predicted toxin-antitoxin system
MNMVIDANLSYRLVKQIKHIFPDSIHIERTGLPSPAKDIDIYNWAKNNNFTFVLTCDDDFFHIQSLHGFPPKVILLRINIRSTQYITELLEKHLSEITDFANNEDLGILEIYEQ